MTTLPSPLSAARDRAPVRAVLDTDTYNEIDDQFALVYALLAREHLRLEAVYAAPFYFPRLNSRSDSPADGMERSFGEIHRVLARAPLGSPPAVFRGSNRFLPDRTTPVPSPAAQDLVRRARATPEGERLCVFAIAAISNVASALLLDPGIAERITVVWLGGHPDDWFDPVEFNLCQDIPAAQAVLASGVPFVRIPCKNVAEHLRTTVPEMASHVRGRGPLGDYLFQIFSTYENVDDRAGPAGWSKPVWDLACVAVAIVPEAFTFRRVTRPRLTDALLWVPSPSAGSITVAVNLDRNLIFGDLFARIARLSPTSPAATEAVAP